MWEVDAPLSNDFCGRAGKRRALADVLDVTGNPEINHITQRIQGAIIMPADVAVGIKALGNNRTDNVRVSVDGQVGARKIDGGGKITGWGNADGLCGRRVGWANAAKLKVAGEAGVIN